MHWLRFADLTLSGFIPDTDMKFNFSMVTLLAATFVMSSSACSAPHDGLVSDAMTDEGDILIEYVPPEDSAYEEIYHTLKNTQFYDAIAEDLNASFILPYDIPVKFAECGEENAFYDPETAEISMCYELISYYVDAFSDESMSPEEIEAEVVYAGFFTFYHELGHALVDLYELPIVGREEDVVDSFAAILLTESGETDAVLTGIDQFAVDAEYEAEQEELAFWDEHSLSEQRFYNIACLVYGSDSESYSDWVDEEYLPEGRAEGCEFEYEQASTSWNTLLEPYRQ